MECMYCKGKMVKASAPFSIDRDNYHIYWHELPAWVCTQCGEAYFEVGQVANIQRSLKLMDSTTRLETSTIIEPVSMQFIAVPA